MAAPIAAVVTALFNPGSAPTNNALAVSVQWSAVLSASTCTAATLVADSDRSVQVEGTFGAGGSILIEGSNDGVNYRTLTDAGGTTLVFTSAGLRYITEPTALIRPRPTAGDGTTSLTVTMVGRQ